MVTEIISGEFISTGLPEIVAGSQRSVRRCELVTNKDSGNICNAITEKYSGRINLEQLPQKSVIGNLWLPEKLFDKLIW